MDRNVIIGLVALGLVLVIGIFFVRQKQTQTLVPELPPLVPQAPTETPNLPFPEIPPLVPPETPTPPETTKVPSAVQFQEFIIRITERGFEPMILEVPRGAKVTFVNESANPSWPASDLHPTHRLYPGSGIEKCGTPEQANIFDACRGLEKGESWSFVFNEVGEWPYHDHLNPSLTGKIIVK